MEGLQTNKKKLNAFWEYIRVDLDSLKEWLVALFELLFELAKKEKRKIANGKYRASPKTILNS